MTTIFTIVCTRCHAGWEIERRAGDLDVRAPACPLCNRTGDVEVRGDRIAVSLADVCDEIDPVSRERCVRQDEHVVHESETGSWADLPVSSPLCEPRQ